MGSIAISNLNIPVAGTFMFAAESGDHFLLDGFLRTSMQWQKLQSCKMFKRLGFKTKEDLRSMIRSITTAKNLKMPEAPDCIVLITALDDYFINHRSAKGLWDYWQGSILWYVYGGHVFGFISHVGKWCDAVELSLNKLEKVTSSDKPCKA